MWYEHWDGGSGYGDRRGWRRWIQQLYTAMDNKKNEWEQAWIRIGIALGVAAYSFSYVQFEELDSTLLNNILTIAEIYFGFAIVMLGWVKVQPAPSIFRRIFTMVADVAVLSIAMAMGGKYGAGWYPAYLWVAFGNGLRFGVPYLVLGSVLSGIGFIYVATTSPFWEPYPEIAAGLIIGLIILPYYVSRLLHRLQNAIQRADRASQEKSRFLSSMSHEIRTPLNGVIATADVLSSMELPSEARRLVRTVQSSSQAVLAMINDILDIGKIEMGRMPVASTVFQLRDVLLEVRDIIGAVARQKNIVFSFYCSTDIPDRLEGDPAHIRQILLNIAGNAVKFTRDGEVAIRVRAGRRTGDKFEVMFEVSDTGIGISADQRDNVFRPFMQVARAPGSAGLGVTIARELAELMGGSIRYESEVGVGTTFYVSVPFLTHDDDFDSVQLEQPEVVWVGVPEDRRERLASVLDSVGIRTTNARELKSGMSIDDIAQNSDQDVLVFVDWRVNQAGRLVRELIQRSSRLRQIGCIAWARGARQESDLVRAGATAVLRDGQMDKTHVLRAVSTCIRRRQAGLLDAISSAPEQPIHVIVADGRRINRDVIAMALTELRAEVTLVETGDELLDALDDAVFDVAVVEMSLPDMSGLEAIQTYRMAHAYSEMPFLLVTADATVESLDSLREQGISNVLTKPFRASQLVDYVRELAVEARVSMQSSSETAVDPDEMVDKDVIEELLRLADNDPVFPVTLYRNYVATVQNSLTRIRILLSSGKLGELREQLALLRDVAHSVGAKAVNHQCTKVIAMKDVDFAESGTLILEQLARLCERSKLPLQQALRLVDTEKGNVQHGDAMSNMEYNKEGTNGPWTGGIQG